MKVAIVGGGICGLTAAFYLSKQGHKVFVFEKENKLGGLARSFKEENWQWSLEEFYHHFFTTDKEIQKLAKQLNIANKLFYKTPVTSVLVNKNIYPFDSPLAILQASFLDIVDKLRMAVVTALLKGIFYWKPLEKHTASHWLKKYYGERNYRFVWEPLLFSKFKKEAERISLTWFWARIKKRTRKLGYFQGGTEILVNALERKIQKNGGKIFVNKEITNLKELKKYDKVLVCAPVETFLKIGCKYFPKHYQTFLKQLKSEGAISLVLVLKEKFLPDNTYWLNITNKKFPFVAVVEHTNFIECKYYGGERILYVGGYYPHNHPYFKMNKEELVKEFLDFLKKINPNINILKSFLSKNYSAQPIICTNYSKFVPSITTPVPNLYWASLHHIYPWDRGINYAICLGKKAATEILKSV